MKSILLFLFAFFATAANAQLLESQRAEIRDINIVKNPGFESGVAYWTASGSTVAATTSAANLGRGAASAVWTTTATAQTLTGTQVTVPPGLYARQCLVSALYRGGSGLFSINAYDGSTILATATCASSTTYAQCVAAFTCPSSGTLAARFVTTGNAGTVYLDHVFIGADAQNRAIAVSPKVYSQSKTAIVALGSSGFNGAGHTLLAADFPVTTGKIAFYNLASASDNSAALSCTSGTAACNLTNTGTVPFTGTGYAGASNTAATFNGTTQSLSSTDAFFNPGNGKSFAFGAWFKATAWTPGTAQILASNAATASDLGWQLQNNTDGTLTLQATNTAASYDLVLTTNSTTGTAGSWHHVAMVYDFSATRLKLYLDGKQVASGTLANVRSVTASTFQIGAVRSTPTNFFTGSVQDAFYHNPNGTTALTDDDVRKLYARTFTHSLNIAPENQLLTGNWYRTDSNVANQLSDAWVVHKNTTTLYADFSDVVTGAFVDFAMQNLGATPVIVPLVTFDTGYLSSTPASSYTHGLPGVPTKVAIWRESATNSFEELPSGSYCSATSTALTCDWTGLTVSGSARVRIIASMADTNTAVDVATSASSGLVSATTQSFGGAKTFDATVQIGSTAVTSSKELRLDTADTGANERPLIQLSRGSTAYGIIGINGTTDQLAIGAENDLVIRANGGINFSVDQGVTSKLQLKSNGALVGARFMQLSTTTTSAATGSAYDVFRFLSGSTLVGTNTVSGSLYIYAQSSGGNSASYVYDLMTNGNGVSNATLTQVRTVTRGANPGAATPVTIAADGGGGAVKIQYTNVSAQVTDVIVVFIGLVF